MLAYCSAFKVPVLPSGVVYLTKDSVVANVSSKSKIVIPLGCFNCGLIDKFQAQQTFQLLVVELEIYQMQI